MNRFDPCTLNTNVYKATKRRMVHYLEQIEQSKPRRQPAAPTRLRDVRCRREYSDQVKACLIYNRFGSLYDTRNVVRSL